MKQYKIKYIFSFKDSTNLEYEFVFDEQFNLKTEDGFKPSEWAKLTNHQCKNCPLSSIEHEFCPVAKNIDAIVDHTKNKLSYEKANVRVQTTERTYVKDCDTQEGLLSLFGLIMPTSGCPHLNWFRPLARFHLPFSSIDETMYRVLSMQLVTSFLNTESFSNKLDLEVIKKNYAEIENVNFDFIERIRSHCKGDADVNAVAALDVFAKLFEFEKEADFSAIRKIFSDEKMGR